VPDPQGTWPDTVAHETETGPHRADPVFSRMKPQSQAGQMLHHLATGILQFDGCSPKNHKVVAITGVMVQAQMAGDQVVELVQIPVGQPLAGQIANRQAATPGEGGEQVVTRVIDSDGILGIGSIDEGLLIE